MRMCLKQKHHNFVFVLRNEINGFYLLKFSSVIIVSISESGVLVRSEDFLNAIASCPDEVQLEGKYDIISPTTRIFISTLYHIC